MLTPLLSWALYAPLILSPNPTGATTVDAFFEDWAAREGLPFSAHVAGVEPGPGDLEATIKLSWEGEALLLAVEVVDDFFAEGGAQVGDRLELRFGAKRFEVALNDLEERTPTLRYKGRVVRGARFHGTTRKDGWALEMSLPLKALGDLKSKPTPFAATLYDVDAGAKLPDSTRATAPLEIQLSATAGLWARFLDEQGRGAPAIHFERAAQIAPGGDLERVIITAQDVVVLGRGLPEGALYLFASPSWDAEGFKLNAVELKDLDGRPGAEIYIEHQAWAIAGEVRLTRAQIFGLRDGFLKVLFAQQLIEEDVKAGAEARSALKHLSKRRIQARVAQVKGFNPGNYQPIDAPGASPYYPIPLPWTDPKGVTYALNRDGYWVPGK